MIKYYLFVFSFLTSFYLGAQDFYEWSVGGENTALTFQYLVADESGVVAVGETGPLNTYRNSPRFLQSNNEKSTLEGYDLSRESQLVLFLDKAGKLGHKLSFNARYESIHGVLIDDNKNIILLVEIEAIEYGENDNPIGYFTVFSSREMKPAGFHLVFLTRQGEFIKSVPASTINSTELEINNFLRHPSGTLVLAGTADPGKPVSNKSAEVLGGGGDFVMMLDTTGIVQWVDVVSFRENSCCTKNGQGTSLSITPNGTIYFGSSYLTGGVFSNGLHTLTPTKYTKNKSSNFEAYVISYQKNGKMNWVKPYESQSYLLALYGNNSGVYVSHQTKSSIAFGLKVDTSQAKFNGLTLLDKNGKVQWTNMYNDLKVEHITEVNNQIVLFQTIESYDFNKKVKIDAVELPERTKMVLSTIDKSQKLKVLKTAKFQLENRNDPILIATDLKNNLYIGGIIFCGLPTELNIYDSSLPSVKCYASTPVIGKVLLK
jgi:hypothetical protein